ncbi:oxidoreductase [Dichotomopilus funicola]|uniref:Oxidoreductase n=1 Tax=Dichotomopilus funicola TaxID=1934379 RepID=A0AAN6UX14_9PEZI|nr:oxidoreductase [Dichotomopilus funicola]
MAQLRVLIVGASIAGPAAAYWFAKGGARVTIIERFPQLRTNGQNVDIRTIGVTVMCKMPGLEEAVRAKRLSLSGISFVDTHDRPFATFRATGDPDQQSLVSEYEILRGDLSRILYDMTRTHENVQYVFGEQVAAFDYHSGPDGPVTVTFANNTLPPTEFDLVVAADGATSRTRALALSCSVREHARPTGLWAAYFTLTKDLIKESEMGHAYNAPGGLFIAAGQHPSQPGCSQVTIIRNTGSDAGNPNDPGSLAAFRSATATATTTTKTTPKTETNHPQDDKNLTLTTQPEDNTAPLRAFIAHSIANKGWYTNTIASALLNSSSPGHGHESSSSSEHEHSSEHGQGQEQPQIRDFYTTEISQIHLPTLFHNYRIALLGDAGYAPGPTGAGTSLALAGAYFLAGEVFSHLSKSDRNNGSENHDLSAALKRYDEVMKPLVKELRQIPFGLRGMMAPRTGWGLRVRNWVMGWVCWVGVVGWVQGWIARGAFGRRGEEGAREYQWDGPVE